MPGGFAHGVLYTTKNLVAIVKMAIEQDAMIPLQKAHDSHEV